MVSLGSCWACFRLLVRREDWKLRARRARRRAMSGLLFGVVWTNSRVSGEALQIFVAVEMEIWEPLVSLTS